MNIEQEVINDNKELTPTQKNDLAKKIAGWWSSWDTDRAEQVSTAREIMAETYLNQSKRKFGKGLEWKSDVKMNATYNIKRAKKSIIWREIWSNTSQMFDVRGTNEQTEQQAKLQKAALVASLDKMDVGKQYDDGIDNLYDIGEIVFKTDWERKTRVVKRQKKGIGFVLNAISNLATGAGFEEKPLEDVEIPVYENARVESISPLMFVFDHSKYKVRNKDSWASCIKIYKRFDSLENIKNNKVYTLTPAQLEELKEAKENETEENKELIDLRDEVMYGGEFSILYAHGDFKINGKMYKNYIAEVLADKYLIRFEKNPMQVNPFILCALEYNPITKRGISPLQSTLYMCQKEEELTNTAFDVQKLMANPPCWANEDLVDENSMENDGSLVLAPGKYIKYKNDYNGGLPTEVKLSSQGISDLLGLLDQKISDLSAVSSLTYGNIEDTKRTATELSLADKGSNSQVAKELDTINQDLTIPMIENVADLLATFKDGAEFVYTQEKGKNVEYRVTNEIRQAQYEYIYEDRNAIHDRKAKFQEMFQLFQGAAQNQDLYNMINWREVMTTAVEMIGYDNSEKFFNEESPIEQMATQLKALPQNVQQQVLPLLQQVGTQAVQQIQQQQQEQKLQQEAMMQVQRQQYRDNARAQLTGIQEQSMPQEAVMEVRNDIIQ